MRIKYDIKAMAFMIVLKSDPLICDISFIGELHRVAYNQLKLVKKGVTTQTIHFQVFHSYF